MTQNAKLGGSLSEVETKYDRYNRSTKGRARLARYESSEKGYLRSRRHKLNLERKRIVKELEAVHGAQ